MRVVCWMCDGKGKLESNDNAPDLICYLCRGDGYIDIPKKVIKKFRKFAIPDYEL